MISIPKTSWIIFGISIIITIIVWMAFLNYENQLQENEFDSKTALIRQSILDRLEQYEQVLIGTQGFLATNPKTTPADWKHFVDIQLISIYQDIQGIGFAKYVTHEEADSLVVQMRNFGFEDFIIHPDGKRSEYYPVVFIEPLNSRNKLAIGYDSYFEDSRRNTVDISKETRQATLTEKIILVQETNNVQNGFLLMMPVYTNKETFSTENDSSSFIGTVNVVFRINDFVESLLGQQTFQNIHMKIYDETIVPENLFFDSEDFFEYNTKKMEFSKRADIEFGNRNWIFVFDGTIPIINEIDVWVLTLIPFIGFAMSILLFYIFYLTNKNLQLVKNSVKNEKMSYIGKLASSLAHDIRNPLSIIQLGLDNLKIMSVPDEKQEKQFDQINRSIFRIDNYIHDVLDFLRERRLTLAKTKMSEIINDALNDVVIPNNIKVALPKNDITLLCDKNQLSRAITNLILNSIQAIEGEGRVELSIDEKKDSIIIKIMDSGSGISKDSIDSIFDPLFTTKQHGTGLGLVGVKLIVELHGGKISVTSKPTIFTITLPKISIEGHHN